MIKPIDSPTHFTLGLTSEEARRRLLEFGANEIVPSRFESGLLELRKILFDTMGLMLLGLAILYALLGNKSDSIILFLAYIPVTIVDVILELRAQRALKELRATLKSTSKVLRDGRIQEISIKNIVVGDVIVFEEGQSLPADGAVIESDQLGINEGALTGESLPVEKNPGTPFFGGTTVLQGRGLGCIERTGKQTQFGKIAALLEETQSEKTPLQKKVNHLVRRVVLIAIVLAVLLFIIEYVRGNTLIQSIIVAMTFGMAAVPEEFPLVFTLYLSMGAWRLSRHGVLVKSLPSVEALGSVDVICTDKTGTLTEGKFQLEEIKTLNDDVKKELLWRNALMACEEKVVDAMESAIVERGKEFRNQLVGWHLKWDYPFESQGKHMSHVWQNKLGQSIIVMKGAAEGVLEHCVIDQQDRERLTTLINSSASQGKRLLGLACREGECTGKRDKDEKDLTFLGILIFNDPIRSTAKHAIEECQKAGIAVKMLTGDHPLTAHAVADETGIIHSHEFFFTGDQLAKMSQEQRWDSYLKGAIFSRIIPEQKHEMVQALKNSGKIVAMTGDGINDAPALKLADIGISMGASATDVARSTAQMVLLKNDFRGIVEAVLEGRRIFSNLKRSFSYLISFHIPIVVLAFIPPLLGWGDLLLPIHIILLELIVHPVSAFSFENLGDAKIFTEKSLMPKRRVFGSILSGLLLSFFCLLLYRLHLHEFEIAEARALVLATIFFGNCAFVLAESWPLKTRRLFITEICLLVLTILFIYFPGIGELFHLSPLKIQGIVEAFFMGVLASVPRIVLFASDATTTPTPSSKETPSIS